MNNNFQSFVDKIANQVDCNKAEKADLYEELISHLTFSKEEFLAAGYEEQEAEEKAIVAFGNANEIGAEIQQAKFPFRRSMLLTLAVASILFSFIVYLLALFTHGDAHFAWLIISIIISSTLLLFALQIFPTLDRKLWLNVTLILHVFFYLYGTLIAVKPIVIISGWILIGLAISLIYLTAIYVYNPENKQVVKQLKRLHILNISVGIIIIVTTLFFIWGILAFGGEATPRILIIFIPLLIWLIAYIVQIKLINHNKGKLAYTIALIPVLLGSGVLLLQALLLRP